MAKISVKAGVAFKKDSVALGRILAELLTLSWPVEIIITAGSDGVHAPNSRHYRGEAVDLRTSNQPDAVGLRAALEAALGPKFSVLPESDHLHVQIVKGGVYP